MLPNLTAFEAAALADCRRDGVGGYRAVSYTHLTLPTTPYV